MLSFRFGFLSLTLVLFAHCQLGIADNTNRLSFVQDKFSFETNVGVPFTIELPNLLSDSGDDTRVWSTNDNKPDWLILDTGNERLTGTPSATDIGTATFILNVRMGEDGAIAQISIKVVAPPQWTQSPLDLGIQNEGKPFEFNLGTMVTNPAGGTLQFTAENLPAWMTLNSNGKLSGTPARPDVGKYTNITFNAISPGGSTSVQAFGEVLKTIKPPSWKTSPTQIDNAFEDKEYTQDISDNVSNPEGTPLEFTLVSGPAWISLSKAGILMGTPGQPDIGAVSLVARFKTTIDGQTFQDSAEFKFEVIHVNHPPKWPANPIVLPDAFTSITYSQDLAGGVIDPDIGDTHTFRILSGPNWAKISNQGVLSGTPNKDDVGKNQWRVEVKDSEGLSDETTVTLTVIKSNEPPIWTTSPVVLPKAKEDFPFTADLKRYVTDPDGDSLTFHLVGGDNWVQVSPSGGFMGTPGAQQVGLNKFQVRVSDGISGSAVVDVLLEVEHTNHPPIWIIDPIVFQVKEDEQVSLEIAPFAKDQDAQDTLTFSALSGVSWATVSSDGNISGTPKAEHTGTNEILVQVNDGAGGNAEAKVIIEVIPVNHAPFWTESPIKLANAKEKQLYLASLIAFAKDPDPNDSLRFNKVSGPAWLSVSANGSVSGFPNRSDVGTNTFQVRVLDRENLFAIATVIIEVEKVNIAPRWRQSPVLLSDALEDSAYGFNLGIYAVDDDGDALSFSKVSGPDWLTVSSDGIISGTPRKDDVGKFTSRLAVSDGEITTENDAVGEVFPTNHAPTIHEEQLKFTVNERQTLNVSLNESTFVEDSDGDSINFQLVSSPGWVSLSNDGELTLTPLFQHIGVHKFSLRVNDGKLHTEGTLQVTVLRDPRPPIWLAQLIEFEARTNEIFVENIADKAKDLDGLSITFAKVEGPDWLNVSPDGAITGTPKEAHLGKNTFTLSASNDELSSNATVVINVVKGTQIDIVKVDAPVPGAKAENLWVIDSSRFSHYLTSALKSQIHHYFEALQTAEIHHTAMFLSSDAREFDGKPISGSSKLLRWDNPNLITDFKERIENSHSNNCYNTPIFSMYRFYQHLPDFDEIYKTRYFEPRVPMDTVMVTQQHDHYRKFTWNTSLDSYNTTKFTNHFVKLHEEQQKPLRIHAIAPTCPYLLETSGELWTVPEADAYVKAVTQTKGTYFPFSCDYEMAKILKKLASKVITRAYILAKRSIKLTELPIETDTIQVTLGGNLLPGNTGSEDDKWFYDASSNSVFIHWHRINLSDLKKGDSIVIEYRTS